MTITDEMVEKAWAAFEALPMDAHYSQAMRAALEAVAPMIAAQALREAAKGTCTPYYIEARAQELDPHGRCLCGEHESLAECRRAQELDPQ